MAASVAVCFVDSTSAAAAAARLAAAIKKETGLDTTLTVGTSGQFDVLLDGKMHDLTVRLSKPDLIARARKRYLASTATGGVR